MECWKNGIMIVFGKTQYSNIPSFQVPRGAVVRKPFNYGNLCPYRRSVLEDSDPAYYYIVQFKYEFPVACDSKVETSALLFKSF
jgi:hypothetical protein